MVKIFKKVQQFKSKRQVVLFSILFLLVVAFAFGIKLTYAYYNSNKAFTMIGTKIGDFNTADGDINLIVYKQNDNGKYSITKIIPSIGYILNPELTECDNEYTIIDNKITFISMENTTCKFYFDQESTTDVKILLMLEKSNGNHIYNNIKYKETQKLPQYGYNYLTYNCDNNDAITYFNYNDNTNKVTINSKENNICYVYFEKIFEVNIYIEQENSNVYAKVDEIPNSSNYTLSSTTESYCVDDNNNTINSSFTYENGNLNADVDGEGTCYVYLDFK